MHAEIEIELGVHMNDHDMLKTLHGTSDGMHRGALVEHRTTWARGHMSEIHVIHNYTPLICAVRIT